MKPIIGIIEKNGILPSKKEIAFTYNEIIKKIIKANGIPIGINRESDMKELLKITNGIILQGGDDYTEDEINLVKYLYEKDIPLLGICLGMQTMGVAKSGTLFEIKNKKHQNKTHEVYLKKDSKIYEMLKKEKITVNSRHNFALKKTTLDITGKSEDNIIEVIEDKTKKFFIGIQWHPESLEDENSNKIFEYFIKKASKK